jgi:hypothetical protein
MARLAGAWLGFAEEWQPSEHSVSSGRKRRFIHLKNLEVLAAQVPLLSSRTSVNCPTALKVNTVIPRGTNYGPK